MGTPTWCHGCANTPDRAETTPIPGFPPRPHRKSQTCGSFGTLRTCARAHLRGRVLLAPAWAAGIAGGRNGDEPADKPDSVAARADDHPSATVVANGLPPALPRRACDLPAGSGGQPSNACADPKALLGLAPGGVCRAAAVTCDAVVSCTAVSPLPDCSGGLFSVALSRGSPRVDVVHHPALWSPDFPQRRGAAVIWPTRRRAVYRLTAGRPSRQAVMDLAGHRPGRISSDQASPDFSVRTRMRPHSSQCSTSVAGAAAKRRSSATSISRPQPPHRRALISAAPVLPERAWIRS